MLLVSEYTPTYLQGRWTLSQCRTWYVGNGSPTTCIPQILTPVRSQTAILHAIERAAEAALTQAGTDNAPLKTHINALPPPHTHLIDNPGCEDRA